MRLVTLPSSSNQAAPNTKYTAIVIAYVPDIPTTTTTRVTFVGHILVGRIISLTFDLLIIMFSFDNLFFVLIIL